MKWPQFSLSRLCAATALTAIPFALSREFPHLPVFVFVVVAGCLWGSAFGLLVARTRTGIMYGGLAGIVLFGAWACLALAIDSQSRSSSTPPQVLAKP